MPFAYKDPQADVWVEIVYPCAVPLTQSVARPNPEFDPSNPGSPATIEVAETDLVTVHAGHFEGMDAAEREALGVLEIVETLPPTGVRVLGPSVETADGRPKRAWITEAHSPESLAALRAAKITEVKVEARRRIVERYPEWKQLNMTARGVELTKVLADQGAWSEAEAVEAARLQADWDWIKAVRAASNALEAAIPEDAEGLAAFVVASRPEWPAPE